jgi:hypothetical protein
LEKIIQIPLRIPPLTEAETETYLNLLGCQLHLDPAIAKQLAEVARANRGAQLGFGPDVAMNYGIVRSHVSQVPAALQHHMELVARIAPTLCGGLEGNPRQTKRFMNTLLLRQRLATARAITLDAPVLAKLMLLEYFHEDSFKELFQWQASAGGAKTRFKALESAVRAPTKSSTRAPAELQGWLTDDTLQRWLLLDPPLAEVDLAPYLYFSRDRVLVRTAPSRRLSQQLQELAGQLLSDSDSVRKAGVKTALTLGIDEFRPLYDHLLQLFVRDPRAVDNKLGRLVVELAAERRALVPALAKALAAALPTSIQPALPVQIATVMGGAATLPPEITAVLSRWAEQTEAPRLATGARRALEPSGRP